MADIGHNSGDIGGEAAKQLLLFIERWERLDEEKKGISDDQKDIMLEAKGTGFNPKMMKKMIALRKLDRETREQEAAEAEAYMTALGLY
jgi:uncharacterized protein (UPF0335 family)